MIENAGDLSKARRLLDLVDQMLEVVTDEETFGGVPFKELEAIQSSLFRARTAISNLLRRYGEVVLTSAPKERRDRL